MTTRIALALLLLAAAPSAGENTTLPSRVYTPVGWMGTEDRYLPGVVHRELGWFTQKQECLKAQAVAARTYVLRFLNANGMTAKIPSLGPSFQAWTSEYRPHDVSAVGATRGQVMTYQGLVLYGNFVSGAWPIDADGDEYASSRYEYVKTWTEIRSLYVGKQNGSVSSSTWAYHVTNRNGWAWTEILTTDNEGRTGSNVVPTIHNSATTRNRGGLGQYRAYHLDANRSYDHARILRFFYGADVVIVGTTPPQPAPPPAPSALAAFRVTADVLNVRTGPGTSYSRLGSISSGQVFVAAGSQNGWQKIYWKGRQVWASGSYLAQVHGVAAARVNTAELNVRSGPSTGYAIVGEIHQGEVYAAVAEQGAWHRLRWDGSLDWAHGGYLVEITVP